MKQITKFIRWVLYYPTYNRQLLDHYMRRLRRMETLTESECAKLKELAIIEKKALQ